MDEEIVNHKTFQTLEQFRNQRRVDFSNIIESIEAGECFGPFWPMFGIGLGNRVEFIRTEELYGQLLLLAEVNPWYYATDQNNVRQLPIENLNPDIEAMIISPRMISPVINELDSFLRALSSTDLEGLVKMMEINDTKTVLIPVLGRGNDKLYRIDADYFLDALMDVAFDKCTLMLVKENVSNKNRVVGTLNSSYY